MRADLLNELQNKELAFLHAVFSPGEQKPVQLECLWLPAQGNEKMNTCFYSSFLRVLHFRPTYCSMELPGGSRKKQTNNKISNTTYYI